MNLTEYQQLAVSTAIYPRQYAIEYPVLGLAGEIGEIANKVKKRLRDNADNAADIVSECGDAFWYVAATAHDIGIVLDDEYLQLPSELFSLTRATLHLVGRVGILAQNQDADLARFPDNVAFELKCICGLLHVIVLTLGDDAYRVLDANIDKLRSRKERGVLSGSGDNR